MFINRVVFKGAPGQLGPLGDALRRLIQPGDGSVLAMRLWGDGPYFALLRAYETLDAVQKAREAFTPDPAFAARLPTLLTVPPISELWELPDVSTANPPAGVGRFTTRFSFAPAPGNGADVLAAVRETAQRLTAAGNPHSLWLRVSGGPATVGMVGSFENLAALEKARAAALADPALRERTLKLIPLLAAPVETPDVFELLVRPQ